MHMTGSLYSDNISTELSSENVPCEEKIFMLCVGHEAEDEVNDVNFASRGHIRRKW
jgi:hypothetical protein